MSPFVRLVSYRDGQGGMLITTNKDIKDRPDILAGDDAPATTILNCLLHRS